MTTFFKVKQIDGDGVVVTASSAATIGKKTPEQMIPWLNKRAKSLGIIMTYELITDEEYKAIRTRLYPK